MGKPDVINSFEEYRRRFFPSEQSDLYYDDPVELGKQLAEQHLQMVQEAIRDWASEVAREQTKNKDEDDRSETKGQ